MGLAFRATWRLAFQAAPCFAFRTGPDNCMRGIAHRARRPVSYLASRSSPGALSRSTGEFCHLILQPHFAAASARASSLLPAVAGDLVGRFERFRTGRASQTAILSAVIVEQSLQAERRFAKSVGAAFAGRPQKEGKTAFDDFVGRHYRAYAASLGELGISRPNTVICGHESHVMTREDVWRTLMKAGLVYRGLFEGWMAWNDESFFREDESNLHRKGGLRQIVLSDSRSTRVLTDAAGDAVYKTKQVAFMFRLSRFRDRVIRWLLTFPDAIQPQSARDALLATLTASPGGLPDIPLTIPRSRFPFGAQVPEDPNQCFSAWYDVFCGYLTSSHGRFWPPTMQLLHRESLQVHAAWIAMLMALELPLPLKVWALPDVDRIGDGSTGAQDFLQRSGADAVRWYLCSLVEPGADVVAFSHDALVRAYGELAEHFNGLVDDLGSPPYNPERIVPLSPGYSIAADASFQDMLQETPYRCDNQILQALDPRAASRTLVDLLARTRAFLRDGFSKASGSSPARRRSLLYHGFEALRIICTLADASFLPDTFFAEALDSMGVPAEERTWDHAVSRRIGGSDEQLQLPPGFAADVALPPLPEVMPWVDETQ